MLSHLTIRNYALIAELDTDLGAGLTIVTGETGAGKSIMLGALQLLRGMKYDSNRAGRRNGEKTVVEAIFTDAGPDVLRKVAAAGIDSCGDELILRREISPSGRSRSFVNDTPVPLSLLAEITSLLCDIHSQHSNTEILTPRFQLNLLDSFGGHDNLIREYAASFARYVRMRREIARFRAEAEAVRREKEILLYRYEELKALQPLRDETRTLETRFGLLDNAGKISSALRESVSLLDTSDVSILSSLGRVKEILDGVDTELLETAGGNGSDIPARLNSAMLELRDIAYTLQSAMDNIEENPAELEKTSDRLSRLYSAAEKFGVDSPDRLPDFLKETENRLRLMDSGYSELARLEAEAKVEGKKLQQLADALSAARSAASVRLASSIQAKASPLGLENLRVEIVVERSKLTPDGQDKVTVLCSFNKNQLPMPLSHTASGGEMSRLMLAIKAMQADDSSGGTIIFDEIDTGVSGGTAARMGELMLDISRGCQVIAITHLPQIAAKGNRHLKVYKRDNQDSTSTCLEELTDTGRTMEIARMLSGTTVGEASLSNARELLRNND